MEVANHLENNDNEDTFYQKPMGHNASSSQ